MKKILLAAATSLLLAGCVSASASNDLLSIDRKMDFVKGDDQTGGILTINGIEDEVVSYSLYVYDGESQGVLYGEAEKLNQNSYIDRHEYDCNVLFNSQDGEIKVSSNSACSVYVNGDISFDGYYK